MTLVKSKLHAHDTWSPNLLNLVLFSVYHDHAVKEKKYVLNKAWINIFMELKPANHYPISIWYTMNQSGQTLPSEHSIAPENWTDILGAFSREQNTQTLRCNDKTAGFPNAVITV